MTRLDSVSTMRLVGRALYQIRTDDPFLTIENQNQFGSTVDVVNPLHNSRILTIAKRGLVEAPGPGFWASRRGMGARR